MLKSVAKRAGIKKNIHPHLLRHSRATYLAKHLTEQQMKSELGWTAGSSMAAIYVHLSGKDRDEAILKMNGIEVQETVSDSALKTIKCPRCREIQDKKAQFCFKCGLPLTKESDKTIEHDKNAISELVLQLQKVDPAILNALINAVQNSGNA